MRIPTCMFTIFVVITLWYMDAGGLVSSKMQMWLWEQLLSMHIVSCCLFTWRPLLETTIFTCKTIIDQTHCLSVCCNAEDTQNVIAALPPSQVVYFQNSVDVNGKTLDASTGTNYTITFPLPLPANAFWSLTLYNATNLNLINNTINRYDIGDRVSSCAV